MKAVTIERPAANEYVEYYRTYIEKVPDVPLLDFLGAQADSLYELIASIPDARLSYRYAEGKWTVAQLLIHLIDAERIFCYRALCIARGEKKDLPEFDHDAYAARAALSNRTAKSLADEFKSVRESTLSLFRNLAGEEWGQLGQASGHTISVRALAYIIAGHALHHRVILNQRYLASV